MEVVPAIDIFGGKVAFLTGGAPETAEVETKDPVALAREWEALGARRLHVVDLDRALARGENRKTMRAILSAVGLPVQVGGGLRGTGDVEEVLAFRRASAILGTRALRDPEWFEELAFRHPGRLILALDRDGRGVVVEGWRSPVGGRVESWVRWANRLPLDGVLFTDVAREGRMGGISPTADPSIAGCRNPRVAAGGIASPLDLDRLARWGYARAVVGKALYRGRVAFAPTWGGRT